MAELLLRDGDYVPDGQGGQPWYGVPPAVFLRRVKRSFDGAEEKDHEIL